MRRTARLPGRGIPRLSAAVSVAAALTGWLGTPTPAQTQEPPETIQVGADTMQSDTTRFTLVGRVADMATGRPLIAAAVKFPDLKRVAYANLDGIFEMEDFPAGEWHLVIEQYGYHTSETDAVLAPGNEVLVHLRPDPVALEGFRVRTRGETLLDDRARRIPYRVVTLGPEVWTDAIHVDPAAIFRQRASAPIVPCDRRDSIESSTPGCMWFKGGTVKLAVYLDEGPLMGGMEELSMYMPEDIHSIQFIRNMKMLRVYSRSFVEKLNETRISLTPLVY
ncbi:MAG: hypothetical protein HKO53_00740 [Gemmatimonadetes bacterium]|nr:hypothetical protein [Gemmatimonadota bacterium]